MKFLLEGVEVGERPVDGGKADVSNLVQRPELVHHQLADDAAGYLQAVTRAASCLYLLDDGLNALGANRAFLAGLQAACPQLPAIERLSAPVFLEHYEAGNLGLLIGVEAAAAANADPSPSGCARGEIPLIYNFGLVMSAIWALQGIVSETTK